MCARVHGHTRRRRQVRKQSYIQHLSTPVVCIAASRAARRACESVCLFDAMHFQVRGFCAGPHLVRSVQRNAFGAADVPCCPQCGCFRDGARVWVGDCSQSGSVGRDVASVSCRTRSIRCGRTNRHTDCLHSPLI